MHHTEGRWRDRESGYAMVALLIAMSVMAIMMTMALPVWTTAARREKEAELVFRGEQYARAIAMFQSKYGNAAPPNLDALINEKFLRKKYKDPITGEDFQLLTPGMPIPGQEGPAPAAAGGAGRGSASSAGAAAAEQRVERERERLAEAAQRTRQAMPAGGAIIGVVSKSTERSLRLYNGRDRYNEWVFLATQQSTQAGGGAEGGAPGGRGGAAPGLPQPGRGGAGGRGGSGRMTLPPLGRRGGSPVSPGGGPTTAPPRR